MSGRSATFRRIGVWLAPRTTAGATVLLVMAIAAVAAPALAPTLPHERVGPIFSAPSPAHPLGLDDVGADVLTQLLYGARISLTVGILAATVAMLLGGAVGISAGYFGRRVDAILLAVTDYFLVIPRIPFMIVIAAVLGSSLTNIVLVIGVLSWAGTARVLRAQTKGLKERIFVQRARAMGASDLRVITRHIVPHLAPLLIASTVVTVAEAVFLETALSFLGLGDPGVTSWGTMIQHAFERGAAGSGAWWALATPGLAVSATVLSLTLIGQDLEERLNPRIRAPHLSPRSFTIEDRAPTTVGSAPHASSEQLLSVADLTVRYGDADVAVRDLSLDIPRGARLALVGESGCGKTTTMLAMLGLLPPAATVSGRISYAGHELLEPSGQAFVQHRWRDIAIVFQGSMASFNPTTTIGQQLIEPMLFHGVAPSRSVALRRGRELLGEVGLPATAVERFPHQLSGGMRQRAAIAMSLTCDPKILLADEPTTALDAMVQAQILALLNRLTTDHGLTLVLVTHDLFAAAEVCDEGAVMLDGVLVERGPFSRLRAAPSHPYTATLFAADEDTRGPGLRATTATAAWEPADDVREVRP